MSSQLTLAVRSQLVSFVRDECDPVVESAHEHHIYCFAALGVKELGDFVVHLNDLLLSSLHVTEAHEQGSPENFDILLEGSLLQSDQILIKHEQVSQHVPLERVRLQH